MDRSRGRKTTVSQMLKLLMKKYRETAGKPHTPPNSNLASSSKHDQVALRGNYDP